MIFLHILGTGKTPAEIANSKGHLFEHLARDLFRHLKMNVSALNKSENGKEIDIEGTYIMGGAKFFAECKAQEGPLGSTDVQKFGYKFMTKQRKDPGVQGFLFTMSKLGPKAKEVWAELESEYPDNVHCYEHDEIVALIVEHYGMVSPEVITNHAMTEYQRSCGDTQLLCVGDQHQNPALFWAQLLMSNDGTEPSAVVLYSSKGSLVTEPTTVSQLLNLKVDLASPKLSCFNLVSAPSRLDDVSPSRAVVRVRMSSGWFDYRFPAAPEFFVGRSSQLTELEMYLQNVRDGKTSSRGFLVSGKSGIGKSSLALKARHLLQHERVIFLPIDSRLCDDVSFLFDATNELIFELGQVLPIAENLGRIHVRGLDSLISTLSEINVILVKAGYLAVLFFDQFEKVFEYKEVTGAIRNLLLEITARQLSILFGFAWKSDLWSLAEGFPHRERDDIVRESVSLRVLTQFGQEETGEILKQLEAQWGGKLSIVFKGQLAAFSRGLPWLLKKVCAHVLEQQLHGVTENELIETNMKLQDLFEADLAGLDDEERSLLRGIAPLLPTTLRRLSESFEITNIDRSLHRFIDKRILVKITEDTGGSLANVKYDAYSDIFREFLITGTVPIEDAYYFYTYPTAAFTFFEKIRDRGTLSIDQEMVETGKKIGSLYNLSRDLRSLGLVNVKNRVFTVADNIANMEREEIIAFLQGQLKRNRVISLILSELNANGTLTRDQLADLLQELFPSVEAVEKTWEYYSRTTAMWLHFARLAYYDKRNTSISKVDDESVFEAIDRSSSSTSGYRFPMCFRNSISECLQTIEYLGEEASSEELMAHLKLSHQSIDKVLSDTLNLKFVERRHETGKFRLTQIGVDYVRGSDSTRQSLYRQQCQDIPVFTRFVSIIDAEGDAGITSKKAATILVTEMRLQLADLTVEKLGAMLANWAEYAEIIVRAGRRCFVKEHVPEQLTLFDAIAT